MVSFMLREKCRSQEEWLAKPHPTESALGSVCAGLEKYFPLELKPGGAEISEDELHVTLIISEPEEGLEVASEVQSSVSIS